MILATLCYVKRNNEVLMLHRNKDPNDFHYGKYVLPGGKIEKGESPEDCIKREIEEETGLTLVRPTLRGVITFINQNIKKPPRDDWHVLVYSAQEFHGELRQPREGDLVWILDSQLPQLPMWEGDKLFLPWIERGTYSENH